MDFYRQGVLSVLHLPPTEARARKHEMLMDGWVLAWSVEL